MSTSKKEAVIVTKKDIKEVRKNFLGKHLPKHMRWSKEDLLEHTISSMKKASVDDQIKFLLEQGYIDNG